MFKKDYVIINDYYYCFYLCNNIMGCREMKSNHIVHQHFDSKIELKYLKHNNIQFLSESKRYYKFDEHEIFIRLDNKNIIHEILKERAFNKIFEQKLLD